MATPESAFPGKPLDALADGTTERMDVDAGSDSGPFRDNTTKKGADLQAVTDEAGVFSDITTKKAKGIHKLIRETEASSFGDAGPVVSWASSASLPAPISLPLPLARPASGASAAVAAVPVSSDLAGALLAIAEPAPEVVEPQVFPDVSAPLSPSLDVAAPAVTEKPRPGVKYLLAAGIIVVLVLLIALVSFRMDSHKVPVEPELPQTKAASEPTVAVAIEEPKPLELEPQAVAPVVDEKPMPAPRGGGKRSAAKTVKQVGPAPTPTPAATSAERPVPKLAGRPGADSRPNPFDETRTVSQSQISAVVRNKMNQSALKACYERALKMDNHLTSGRIDVTVSIGMSGMVQHVVVNAPSSFILVEPCIKTAVRRWVFPPSSEEYATNFPLIMQGGM
jgi:hypothetical protein